MIETMLFTLPQIPGQLTYAQLPTGGGTWANGGALAITGGALTLSGDLLFPDATYDVGKPSATRPRDVTASRDITAGGIVKIGVPTNSTGDFLYIGANLSTGILVDIAGSSPIWHNRRANGTQAARTNVAASDVIHRIRGSGWSGATGYWAMAEITFAVDGAVPDNQRPGSRIDFVTNAQNGAQTTQWRINAAGTLVAQAAVGIQTGAPAAGTAKIWKFGQAAAVVPTLQNRTIELEVDGVTYYLTAKTTND